MRGALRPYRLVLFYLLAFPLSWYPWLIALARGTTTGPNPLGPFIAAIIVTAGLDGWPALRGFLARLVRWRVGWVWYLVIFLVPAAVVFASAALVDAGALGRVIAAGVPVEETLTRFVFILLFVGLGEEPGWRGFALEHLQRRRSPLVASLLLAPVWAVWHLPLLGTEFPAPVIAPFVLSVFGGTLVQTWLFNRTRGSVLLQMLFHATVNTIGAGIVFRVFAGDALTELWWVYAGAWALLGTALMLVDPRRPAAS